MKGWWRRARRPAPTLPCTYRWWAPIPCPKTGQFHICKSPIEHYSTPHVCAMCGWVQ